MLKAFDHQRKSSHFTLLAKTLEQKREAVLEELATKHKKVAKWTKKKGIRTEDLIEKGTRGLTAGMATGAVLLSSGIAQGSPPQGSVQEQKVGPTETVASIGAKEDVTTSVRRVLVGVDLRNNASVTRRLSKILKIPLRPKLQGISLNTSYGIIGYESHLSRFPGDNLTTHFSTDSEYQKFAHAGMAGGPGAFGYLSASRSALSEKDIEREKYYLVVQTFLSPNWGSSGVKEWFHHRKMIVVNPQNGKVVVGVVEDAGPIPFTGRSFGGSPEVMEELGFSGGGRDVLMFFVDDPKDKIPLGLYSL